MVALQRLAGNRAAIHLLQRDPELGPPTLGNLPRSAPTFGADANVVRLQKVDGVWKEILPRGGYTRTARGRYAFVVKDGEIYAVKPKSGLTGRPMGHTEAAGGERVSWAGQAEFEAGKLKSWDDGSGHYRPAASFRDTAVDAGLDRDLFVLHEDSAARPHSGKGPQLPVQQPVTKPRTPGEPPKIGPGPPRVDELEKASGGAAGDVGRTAPDGGTASAERASVTVEEMLVAEGAEGAGVLAKVGGAAGVVAEFLLPGPLDAVMLFAAFAGVYGQNRAEERGRGLRSGFAEGLAARLVFARQNAWQLANNELRPRTVDRDALKEVAGTVGAFEGGELEGLKAGLQFGDQLSPVQRKRFLRVALQGARANEGRYWTAADAGRPRETWYTKANVEALALGLVPTVNALLDQEQAMAALRHALKVAYDPIEQAKEAWKLIVG